MLETIRRSALFHGLTEEERAAVGAVGQRRILDRGEVLHYEGSEVEKIFLTLEGVIQVSRSGPDGSSVILRLARQGDVLGAAEWISRGTHKTAAVAAHPSRVLVWGEEEFRRLATRHPVLATNALQIAQVQLEELEERFWEAVTQHVELRIARQVIRLWRQSGSTVEFNIEQLGLMTGTTIYTVSRVLSKWNAMGLIRRHKGRIEIVANDALVLLGEPDGSSAAPTTSRHHAITEVKVARRLWNEAREKAQAARLSLNGQKTTYGDSNYQTSSYQRLARAEIEALEKYRAAVEELKTRAWKDTPPLTAAQGGRSA